MAFPVYAVVGIPVLFLLGLAGALCPPTIAFFFPRYGITNKFYFSFFCGLAAGLILAVGLIHSVPESFEALNEEIDGHDDHGAEEAHDDDHDHDHDTGNSTDHDTGNDTDHHDDDDHDHDSGLGHDHPYPWGAFIVMMGILICFTIEEAVESLGSIFGVSNPHSHGHGHSHAHPATHDDHACGHTLADHAQNDGVCDAQPLEEMCDHHGRRGEVESATSTEDEKGGSLKKSGSVSSDDELDMEGGSLAQKTEDFNKRSLAIVKMTVLFFGLMFHNIFVGITLGASENDRALFIAIVFHQFFEGIGMGARVATASLKRFVSVLVIDIAFAAAAPIGIGIGLGIKSGIESHPRPYNITQGTLQALSAGILIYVALVHMIRGYGEAEAKGKSLHLHKLSSYVGLLIGMAAMSVLGIWA